MWLVERLESVLIGVLSVIIWRIICSLVPGVLSKEIYNNLMTTSATFSSITIGFLATVFSVLVTVVDKPVAKKIFRFDGRDQLILRYLTSVIRWGLALLLISAIGFFFYATEWSYKWFYVWLFFVSGTLAAFERALRTIVAFLRRVLYTSIDENDLD